MARRTVVLTLSVFCCVLVGCGKSDRQGIVGTVLIDGGPLEKGSINFFPLPGTESPTAGAAIENGDFQVPDEGGTFTGRFRVEITAKRPTGRKIPDPRTQQLIEEYEQFIPKRYNQESELNIEVSGTGENRFDFSLVSQ